MEALLSEESLSNVSKRFFKRNSSISFRNHTEALLSEESLSEEAKRFFKRFHDYMIQESHGSFAV